MPFKHEDPGSNPGGSKELRGHSSIGRARVSSILVVALFLNGVSYFDQPCKSSDFSRAFVKQERTQLKLVL